MAQLRSEKLDPTLETFPCTQQDVKILISNVEERLRNSWQWLINIMDSTESQLRFGCALSNRRQSLPSAQTSTSISSSNGGGNNNLGNTTSNNSNSMTNSLNSRIARNVRSMGVDIDFLFSPFSSRHHAQRMAGLFNRTGRGTDNPSMYMNHSASGNSYNNNSHTNSSNSDPNVSRRDFLGYAMSLMRAQSNDHYDSMPVLDVASLKHVAYIFDAFFYYIRQGIKCEQEREAKEANKVTREHGFFKRTSSTLFLGCPPPDPFLAPFHQTLPLADKPHLLTPNARREVLFGVPRPLNAQQTEEMIRNQPTSMSIFKRLQPKWSEEVTQPALKTGSQGDFSSSQPQQHRSVIVMGPSAKRGATVSNLPTVPAPFSGHEYAKVSTIYPNLISAVDESGNKLYFGNQREHDHLLGRWRLLLEAFGRLFVDDVGIEPASIINELITFQVKESKFRREIERLRTSSSSLSPGSLIQQRDFHLLRLERERGALLQQTFKELNNLFSSPPKKGYNQFVNRVKITFKNEPGEGTGVARSFFSAFCEAVLENDKLPTLDWLLPPSQSSSNLQRSYTSAISAAYSNLQQYNLIRVSNNGQSSSIYIRPSEESSRSARNAGRFRLFTPRRYLRTTQDMAPNRVPSAAYFSASPPASVSLARFVPLLRYEAPSFTPTIPRPVDVRDQSLGDLMYSRLELIYPEHVRKIVGMLLDIPGFDINRLVESTEELREMSARAYDVILQHENPDRGNRSSERAAANSSSASNSGANSSSSLPNPDVSAPPQLGGLSFLSGNNSSRLTLSNVVATSSNVAANQQIPLVSVDEDDENQPEVRISSSAPCTNASSSALIWPQAPSNLDDEPLFYQPGPVGFYSPRSGQRSEARLNAFRNIGRMIGICFSQNELCPLSFNRHVIKMILGRPVQWHDLAFFDPALFDSLRHLVLEADRQNEALFTQLDLTFVIDLLVEEGNIQVELKPGGRNIPVTLSNVYEYVQRYALYRMVESQKPAIDNIRDGIFDVLPTRIFDNLMVNMITFCLIVFSNLYF